MATSHTAGSLEVVSVPAGPIETNAFLVIEPKTRHALVVDVPPDAKDALVKEIHARNLTVDAIIITHGHWDHIGDAEALRRELGAPLLAHELSRPRLEQPGSSTFELPFQIEPVTVDRWVRAGDEVALGDRTFSVMFLPGHEPGHIALYGQDDHLLLSGDVLFPNGHGRIDIEGANRADMEASLRQLMELPDGTVVYNGHGLPTTIGAERWWMPRVG